MWLIKYPHNYNTVKRNVECVRSLSFKCFPSQKQKLMNLDLFLNSVIQPFGKEPSNSSNVVNVYKAFVGLKMVNTSASFDLPPERNIQ